MALDRGRTSWVLVLGVVAVFFTWLNWARLTLDPTLHAVDFGSIYRVREIAILQFLCVITLLISHHNLVRAGFYAFCMLTIILIGVDIRILTKFTSGVPLAYYILASASIVVTIGALLFVIRRTFMVAPKARHR